MRAILKKIVLYTLFLMLFLFVSIPISPANQKKSFKDKTGQLVHREFIYYDKEKSKKAELFWGKPEGSEPQPAILYIHGHQKNKSLGGRRYVMYGVIGGMVKLRNWVTASISQPGYGKSDGPPDYCGPASQNAVLAAINFLKSLSFVNPNKIALYGVSRGAITASMVETKDSSLAAVVLISGTYDLVNAYPTGLKGLDKNIMEEAGISKEDLIARSAIYHVNSIKSPTLILHGANDQRLDPKYAKSFAEKLIANKVPVRVKIFENTEHIIPIKLRNTEISPFLNKYMGPIN